MIKTLILKNYGDLREETIYRLNECKTGFYFTCYRIEILEYIAITADMGKENVKRLS